MARKLCDSLTPGETRGVTIGHRRLAETRRAAREMSKNITLGRAAHPIPVAGVMYLSR
jgi:hypothetical protein